jgi:drug/metabolite transporter (DMT)-like permease
MYGTTSSARTGSPAQERRGALAAALLVAATVAWGATFVVVKGAIAHLGVENFLAWRFLIAGGLLLAARPRAVVSLGPGGWARGAGLGLVLTAGYALQTFGLRDVSAAVSGFLTGLQVVFVPLIAWVLLRQRPQRSAWSATALATAGLAAISLGGLASSVGTPTGGTAAGELLTLGSSAVFGLQIVGLGRWSTSADAYGLATVQLLTVGACSSLATLPRGPGLPAGTATWAAIIGTAVAATALAFAVQAWAQAQLSATQVAVLLTLEPVFAALTAWAAGEALGWPALAGGSLVVAGMLVLVGGPATTRARAGQLAKGLDATTSGPGLAPGPAPGAGGAGPRYLGGHATDLARGQDPPLWGTWRQSLRSRHSAPGGPAGAPGEHAPSVRGSLGARGRHGRARLPADSRRRGGGPARHNAGPPVGRP